MASLAFVMQSQSTEEEKTARAQDVIRYLNHLLEVDRHALFRLFDFRTPCNSELADHDTVQVGVRDGESVVGLLGIINGMLGVRPDGWGYVTMSLVEDGRIGRFELTKREGDSDDISFESKLPPPPKPWKPEVGDQVRIKGAHRLAGARGKIAAFLGLTLVSVHMHKGTLTTEGEQHTFKYNELEPSEAG